jgi:aspartyl protease family protein
MQKAPVISLLICAGLVGWLAPNLSTDMGVKVSGENMAAPKAVTASQPAGWAAEETVLKRHADGHFYADGVVEGRQFHFLVDTGASIVALTGQDAEAMGLYWDESKLRPIGRGASGTVHGVPVRIEQMEVGGFEARDVQAAIIPEGLDVSLLGQSFLSQIDNVEISGDEMKLGG